ncbi:MAG: Crp/Fnr family transcriptional regulator [Rikenellaceae bacterium]|jgi:CRP-like cAMP-binding protein|nr:Crp/Fnr family transcriptional regulator [Rikenellaceae bacterium]
MYEILALSELFSGLAPERIEELLAACQTQGYSRGDVIALQCARYDRLSVVVEGEVAAEMHDQSGNRLDVERIVAPSVVAPSCLFAVHNSLPATLTARTAATLLFIDRERFVAMLADCRELMVNFLRMVSSGNRFISERVVYLTYKTIKGRFAAYLLDLLERQQNTMVVNPLTQREMAAMFGVTRPALARAVGEMAAEGSIFVRGKQITALFVEKLRQYARA